MTLLDKNKKETSVCTWNVWSANAPYSKDFTH
jgi:hypothetical protein